MGFFRKILNTNYKEVITQLNEEFYPTTLSDGTNESWRQVKKFKENCVAEMVNDFRVCYSLECVNGRSELLDTQEKYYMSSKKASLSTEITNFYNAAPRWFPDRK